MRQFLNNLSFLYTYSTGIDITTNSIKIITLKKLGKNIHLENFQTHPLPDDIAINNEIVNKEKLVILLKKIAKNIKKSLSPFSEIVTSLPTDKTFTLLLQKRRDPKRSPSEQVNQIIQENIKKYIPYSPDELFYDWQLLDIDPEKILFSAAPKKIINFYTTAFQEAGIPLSVIDLKTAAISRAVLPLYNPSKSIKIIIFIGDNESFIIFGNNSVIEIVFNTNFTEMNIQKLITKKLNITKQDLEKAKSICGFNQDKCKGALKKLLTPFLDDIFSQISRALIFREEKGYDFPIDEIILCGKAYKYKDFDKIISQKLKIKTSWGNPLTNVFINNFDKNTANHYLRAIGLSLRGLI